MSQSRQSLRYSLDDLILRISLHPLHPRAPLQGLLYKALTHFRYDGPFHEQYSWTLLCDFVCSPTASGSPQLQLTTLGPSGDIVTDIISKQAEFDSYLKKLADELFVSGISSQNLFTEIVDLGPRPPIPVDQLVNEKKVGPVEDSSQNQHAITFRDDPAVCDNNSLVQTEAPPDTGDVDEFSGGILSPLADLKFLTKETAGRIAALFCLPSHDTIAFQNKKLPGTRVKLHAHQLIFIYEFIQRLVDNSELLGQYLADDRGMGKTYSGLALIALIRLVQLNQRHILEYPSLHISTDSESKSGETTLASHAGSQTRSHERETSCPCNASVWFGIQCLCEPENPLAAFARGLAEGSPFVVMAQKALISQWVSKAGHFFHRTLEAENYPYLEEPFIAFAVVDDFDAKEVENEQVAAEQANTTGPSTIFGDDRWEDILADVVLPEAKVKKMARQKFPKHAINLEPVLRGSSDFQLHTKPRQVQYKSSGSASSPGVIVFVGQEKVSACFRKGHPYPGRKVVIPRADKRRGGLQVAPFLPLAPALVICDEHHKVHSPAAVFTQYLSLLRDRMHAGEGKHPRFLMMSGTPMPNVPSDIQASFELLHTSASKRTEFCQVLAGIKDLFSRARTRDEPFANLLASHSAQLNQFRACLQKFLIIRRYGSPYLDRHIEDPRPQLLWYEAAFKTPSRYVDAMRDKQKLVRSEVKGLSGGQQGIIRALVNGTVKSVQFLLRVAYWPPLACYDRSEIPYRVEEVQQELKKIPEEDNWFFQHVNESHDIINNDPMYDQLGEIIKAASMGHLPTEQPSRQPRKPRHVVIYTTSPFLVVIVSTVIKSLWSNYADVYRLMARRGGDRKITRTSEIDMLYNKANESGQQNSIVLVTTYDLAGTGLDNMTFFSVLVRLGNPWVHSSVTQAVGRIHRPSFEKGHDFDSVACFHLYRSDNTADELARCRSADRASLLSSDRSLFADNTEGL